MSAGRFRTMPTTTAGLPLIPAVDVGASREVLIRSPPRTGTDVARHGCGVPTPPSYVSRTAHRRLPRIDARCLRCDPNDHARRCGAEPGADAFPSRDPTGGCVERVVVV